MPPIPLEILKQVKGIAIRTRGLVDTLLSGEYRSVFRGRGMEFDEVRAYEPGDDFRSIDWNVSARLGAPFVKTYTEEREVTLFLVVDRSGSTAVGDPVSKADRAVKSARCWPSRRHGNMIGSGRWSLPTGWNMWSRPPRAGVTRSG